MINEINLFGYTLSPINERYQSSFQSAILHVAAVTVFSLIALILELISENISTTLCVFLAIVPVLNMIVVWMIGIKPVSKISKPKKEVDSLLQNPINGDEQ